MRQKISRDIDKKISYDFKSVTLYHVGKVEERREAVDRVYTRVHGYVSGRKTVITNIQILYGMCIS